MNIGSRVSRKKEVTDIGQEAAEFSSTKTLSVNTLRFVDTLNLTLKTMRSVRFGQVT